MTAPSLVEWGCGLGLAVVLGTAIAVGVTTAHAEPAPSGVRQCVADQAAADHLAGRDTGSCQVGSVRNP